MVVGCRIVVTNCTEGQDNSCWYPDEAHPLQCFLKICVSFVCCDVSPPRILITNLCFAIISVRERVRDRHLYWGETLCGSSIVLLHHYFTAYYYYCYIYYYHITKVYLLLLLPLLLNFYHNIRVHLTLFSIVRSTPGTSSDTPGYIQIGCSGSM